MPTSNRPPAKSRNMVIWLTASILVVGVVIGGMQFLSGHRIAEKEISAELVIAKLPQGLTVRPPAEKFIGARVKGPAPLLEDLANRKLTCTLRLAGLKPGLHSTPITAAHFGLPAPLKVTAIRPEIVTYRIKTADRRKLPVHIVIAGKPAAGFTVIDTFAVPGHVTVAGPEKQLAGMERLMTKPINIEGIAESIRKGTALDLPAGIKVVDVDKALVADIRIAAKTGRKTVTGIQVVSRGTGHAAIFSPPEIRLEIEGPADALARLNRTSDITAYIDLAGLKPNVYVKRASISLPLNITLVKAEPELFTVTLKRR